MRTGVSISVSAADRRRLEAIVADPKTPQKHVWRARIILLTTNGIGTAAIMAASMRCFWDGQVCDCRSQDAGIGAAYRSNAAEADAGAQG